MASNTFESLIEPLDKQFRLVLNKKTNTQETIPAIDKAFMEQRDFLSYLPPPVSILNETTTTGQNQAAVDEYLERLKFIEIDLKWALSLDYQHFWSQIIYDQSFKLLIDSYLKYAPRPHDFIKVERLPKQVVDLHNSIQKLVFLVCLRMSTYKETKEHFMSPEAFSNIIYNNYLFDIPKIIDICVLYKKNDILPKMVGNLFKTQEKYFNDFKVCIRDIDKTFDVSKTQLIKLFDLDSIYMVKDKKEPLNERIKTNLKPFIETIYYLTDFAISLNDFITVLPTIGELLSECQLESNIKELLENTIFVIEDKLNKMIKEHRSLNDSLILIKTKLKALKFQLAKLFKKIFETSSISPILMNVDSIEPNKESKLRNYVDKFFKTCSDLLEYEQFLCYYEEKFKLSEQIDIVVQLSGSHIDESTHKFLLDSLKTSILNHSKKKSVKSRFTGQVPVKEFDYDSVTPKTSTATAASTSSQAKIEFKPQSDLAIKSILDLFPDYDISLIKKCLKYFNNNVEEVINAFLENNIPEFPAEAKAQIYEEKTSATTYLDYDNDETDYETLNINSEFSELSLRKNVYDNDDFDIFKKDSIDKSKIILGKKNTTDTFNLDNKEDIDRDFYKNYDHIMFARQGTEENPEEYEDEYDDTYDDKTDAIESLEPDEFIKPLNQKLGIKKRDQYEEDEEEEGNENNSTNQPQQQDTTNTTRNNFPNQNRGAQNQQSNYRQQMPYQQQQNRPQQQQEPKVFNQNGRNDSQKQPQRHQNPKYNRNPGGFDDDNRRTLQQPQNQQQQQQPPRIQNYQQDRNDNDSNQRNINQPRQALPQRQIPQNRPRNDQPRNDQIRNNQPRNQEPRAPITNEEKREGADSNEKPAAKTEEEIKRERRWKNENKSKTVHHNRKDLAAKKSNFF